MAREQNQRWRTLKQKATSIGISFLASLVLASLLSVCSTALWAMGVLDAPEYPSPDVVYFLPEVTIASLIRTFFSHLILVYVFLLLVAGWHKIRDLRK
jgi:hypothetical protein